MLNHQGFNKYQLQKKFILQQLVAKITNFTDIRRNNINFPPPPKKQNKTTSVLKLPIARNLEFYRFSTK